MRDLEPWINSVILSADDTLDLIRALSRLKTQQRFVVLLRAYGYTLEEIGSEVLGVSRERVRQIVLSAELELKRYCVVPTRKRTLGFEAARVAREEARKAVVRRQRAEREAELAVRLRQDVVRLRQDALLREIVARRAEDRKIVAKHERDDRDSATERAAAWSEIAVAVARENEGASQLCSYEYCPTPRKPVRQGMRMHHACALAHSRANRAAARRQSLSSPGSGMRSNH